MTFWYMIYTNFLCVECKLRYFVLNFPPRRLLARYTKLFTALVPLRSVEDTTVAGRSSDRIGGGRRWRASPVLVTPDCDLRYSTCYARRTVTPRFFVLSSADFGEFLFQVLRACVIWRAETMSRYSQRPENALKRANGK